MWESIKRWLYQLLGDVLWPERKKEREEFEAFKKAAESKIADLEKTITARDGLINDLNAQHNDLEKKITEVISENSNAIVDSRTDDDLLHGDFRSSDRGPRS